MRGVLDMLGCVGWQVVTMVIVKGLGGVRVRFEKGKKRFRQGSS